MIGGVVLTAIGLPLVDAFFSSFSCVSNIGLGAGVTGYGGGYSLVPTAGKWLLALLMLLPMVANILMVNASAVTQAEIDALKSKSSTLASQKKDIQAQLKAVQADKSTAMKRNSCWRTRLT